LKIALIVNPLIPVPPQNYGGIERIVSMLINELSPRHEITLFANAASTPGCKLIAYTEADKYGLKDFLRINLLTSKILWQQFDVVHTFGRMNNIAFLMAARLPKVVSYQLPPTLSQVKKAVKIAPHGSLFFTACSNYISQQIKNDCDVTTIYNGVELSDYLYNPKVDADAPLIFLGRIQQEKGTDIAIDVALRTNRKLIIAGNIPHEARHQQYFEEKIKPQIDGKQIIYIGAVNNTQKNELLGNAAALLMPVTWDEPFGIVMTEALACGTPVIGFARGAVPEVITNNVNGFVCTNTDKMVDAVNNISAIDRNTCRKIAEEKFSSGLLVAQYEALYKKITGKV